MAEEPTGFAGFESLVTDLSDLPAPAAPATPRSAKRAASGRSFPVWIFIFIGVSLLRLLATIPNNGQPSVTNHYPVPVTVPVPPSQPYKPASPAAATEEKPPVGQGAFLSEPQIRYCLSQGIRIQGADKAMNADSKAEVTRFLALVDDYSPRCGNYRAGPPVMQYIKSDVEAQLAALELEGAALIRPPAEEKKPPAAPIRPPAEEAKSPAVLAAPLSGSQGRDCVAQRMRIQAAEKAVNLTSKAEVKRFQALLDDYKQRCGDYRSVVGVKQSLKEQSLKEQSLKEEMEALRATLIREGVIRPPAGPR